jgi:hypothetical protein
VHFFDLVVTHSLGINKNHMANMRRPLVAISSSIRLYDSNDGNRFGRTVGIFGCKYPRTRVVPRSARAIRISLQPSTFCFVPSEDYRGHQTSIATPSDRDLSYFIVNSAG